MDGYRRGGMRRREANETPYIRKGKDGKAERGEGSVGRNVQANGERGNVTCVGERGE